MDLESMNRKDTQEKASEILLRLYPHGRRNRKKWFQGVTPVISFGILRRS
jgi:hypothetical protein